MDKMTLSLNVLFIYILIQGHFVLNAESYACIIIIFPSETSQEQVNMLSFICIDMRKPHNYFVS